jgi:Leucine-rich repeat (LRR) protein
MAKNEANRRIEAGAVLLILTSLVTALGAGELVSLPSGGQAGATKTLSFPPDQWIGNLSLEPDSGPGWDAKGVRLFGEWEQLAAARGDVRVPRDWHVWLSILLALDPRETARLQRDNPRSYQFYIAERTREPPLDLSGLLRLDPNDLFRLSVGSPMYQRTGAAPAIFEPIGHLTGLEILSLSGSGITDAGLEHLRPLRSLKALELMQSSIGTRGLAVLKELPALEHLELAVGVTDAGLKEVAQASNLRWLNLIQGRFWGPGLAELAKLPRLERLCIQSILSDRHIQCLEGLTHLKGLSLWYVGDALTDASLASIARMESLEELYIVMSSPKFTPAGVAHLKSLKNLKLVDFGEFTWITPAGQQYGDEVARQLAGMSGLESILGVGYLSAEGMKVLSTMPNLKRLKVTLKDAEIGYSGPMGLSFLAHHRSLEELNISIGDPLPDSDFTAMESLGALKNLLIFCPSVSVKGMASIGKLRQLEDLTLMTRVTREGLNQLNGLSRLRHLQASGHYETPTAAPLDEATLDLSGLKRLTNLHLGGLSLGDEDLAFVESLSSLERLMIQPTSPLMGESLRHLGDLPELDCLLLYNLSNCSGEDLACLGGLPKLRYLRASGDITDAALASLRGPSRLGSLDVRTNAPIRRETVTDLAARLPQLEYVHISEAPPWVTRSREAGKGTGPDPARPNRRAPAAPPRGRR